MEAQLLCGNVLFTLFIFSNLQHRDTGGKDVPIIFFLYKLTENVTFSKFIQTRYTEALLKSRIICFSTSSPRSLTSPDGSVRELEPRSRLQWSCGAGVASSECPASADVYQPNDFREAPTHNTHNRMTDESQKPARQVWRFEPELLNLLGQNQESEPGPAAPGRLGTST